MEKNKKLSIVIVSYNSKKNLENCIESIYKKIGSSVDW
jgi:GT2 family glycosyltransferase